MRFNLALLTIFITVSTTSYSQQGVSNVTYLAGKDWITYDILKDTIELTRIRPFKKYGLIKMLSFNKATSKILYGYTSIPKKVYWICGTGELDVDMHKSNFRILENGRLLVEIYSSMLSDKSYYYHYIKEFKCEKVTRNKWRLINVCSKVNDVEAVDFD